MHIILLLASFPQLIYTITQFLFKMLYIVNQGNNGIVSRNIDFSSMEMGIYKGYASETTIDP